MGRGMSHAAGERPFRVVMVVRLFHPWVGGAERQAHRLSRRLHDDGVDVRIVTGWWFRGTPQREVLDGIPVFRNHTLWECFGIRGARKFGGYLYILTLAWHLWRTRGSYDVIHVHGLGYHAAVAAWIGRRIGRPTIAKLANSGPASDILKMRRGQQLAFSHLLLPLALRCDRFVAVNPMVARELRAAGVAEGRIVPIPNGIEVPARGASPGRREGALRIVAVGRLHEQKGFDTLLRAFAMLRERAPARELSLTIVGDGPERASLAQLASSLGVAADVELAGERDDVGSFLRGADVFALASRAEGLSNALLEAMAEGVAVVVSDIPGNADVVTDGVDGMLAHPDDPRSFADALERVLLDRELRRLLADAGRETVIARYSIAGVAARYRALYAQVTEPGFRSPIAPEDLHLTYVIGTYPLLTTTFIDREIDALRQRGIDVAVVSLRRPATSSDRSRGVSYVLPARVPALVRSHFRFAIGRPVAWATCLRLLTRPHPDARARVRTLLHIGEGVLTAWIVATRHPRTSHLHAHFVDRASVVAMVAARLLGVPYSATAHANDIYVAPVLLPEKVHEAKFVATCTGFNRAHLVRTLGGEAAAKITCVYHGLDLRRYTSRPTPPPREVAEILSVAQLKEKKGLRHLIDACAILLVRGYRLHCSIVGAGPLEQDLRTSIARHGMQGCIELLGALPHDEVLAHYRSASLFVLPAITAPDGDRDGIPNVILEAMAIGVPVVATRHSGLPEAITDGRSGLLVPMGDPGALADAIGWLLEDEEHRERLTREARRAVSERFDIDVNAENLLEELLA